MEKKNFPWLRPVEMEQVQITESEITPSETYEKLKKLLPFTIFFMVLALLFFFKEKSSQKAEPESNRYVDVLVVMLPTPKGSALLPETLKQVPVDRKSLSKAQFLQLVRF